MVARDRHEEKDEYVIVNRGGQVINTARDIPEGLAIMTYWKNKSGLSLKLFSKDNSVEIGTMEITVNRKAVFVEKGTFDAIMRTIRDAEGMDEIKDEFEEEPQAQYGLMAEGKLIHNNLTGMPLTADLRTMKRWRDWYEEGHPDTHFSLTKISP